jgi:tetratricopeptide (TPR) repeat protein
MDIAKIPFEAYKGTDPYLFVSYAHKDSDKVFPIIAEFHKAGFPIWYDEGIDPGNEWPEEIANALLKCSLFIVFISSSAVASANVRNEINMALAENKAFIHIWLEDLTLSPGLKLQITSKQGIMFFRMEQENFARKWRQSFEEFGIKTQVKSEVRAKLEREVEEVTAYKNGVEAFNKSDYEKAIAHLEDALKLAPYNTAYQEMLGQAKEKLKKVQELEEKKMQIKKEKPLRIVSLLLCLISSSIFFYIIYISPIISVMKGSLINGAILGSLVGVSVPNKNLSTKIGMLLTLSIIVAILGLFFGWIASLIGDGVKITWAIITFLFCFLPMIYSYDK